MILLLLALAPLSLGAQEQEDNTFGGWEFIEVNHQFGKGPIFGSFYFEHDNYQYKRLEGWYTRTTLGVKILPWLSADVAYDFLYEPKVMTHKLVVDVTASHREGNFKVGLRERYMHSWEAGTGKESDVLRSRLKVQYIIPNSRWSPYVAIEVFTWGTQWKKTRHYAACNFTITKWMEAEAYYMYYAFNNAPAEHVIGLGLNFYL